MGEAVRTTLGVLVPEFPSQTHAFFWREVRALRALGVTVHMLSTRRPPADACPHPFAAPARAETEYLFPPGAASLLELVRRPVRAAAAVRYVLGLRESALRRRVRYLGLIPCAARLVRHARRRGIPHVHVHSCGDAAHVAALARVLGGPTYSLTLHGPLNDYGPDQRAKWRHAAFSLVITQKLTDEVSRELAGDLPPVVRLAPMGVDLSKFTRAGPYRPWGGTGRCRLFSCGRLNPCKAHHDLVTAVALLRDRYGVEAELRIAGGDDTGGRTRAALDQQVATLGLTDRVTFLGVCGEDVVRSELESAHAFALASAAEPLGVVLMEAMAMQVPVVSTGAGGVAELIADGTDGVLVPPHDPEGLAAALARVLRTPATATALAAAGHRKVTAEFSSTRGATVLMDCVRRLTD
ncbi:MAG: exopolysaccharide biosynthesis GT4 family glycosyltransferase EpsE [Gemmataceae bacterium]